MKISEAIALIDPMVCLKTVIHLPCGKLKMSKNLPQSLGLLSTGLMSSGSGFTSTGLHLGFVPTLALGLRFTVWTRNRSQLGVSQPRRANERILFIDETCAKAMFDFILELSKVEFECDMIIDIDSEIDSYWFSKKNEFPFIIDIKQ